MILEVTEARRKAISVSSVLVVHGGMSRSEWEAQHAQIMEAVQSPASYVSWANSTAPGMILALARLGVTAEEARESTRFAAGLRYRIFDLDAEASIQRASVESIVSSLGLESEHAALMEEHARTGVHKQQTRGGRRGSANADRLNHVVVGLTTAVEVATPGDVETGGGGGGAPSDGSRRSSSGKQEEKT